MGIPVCVLDEQSDTALFGFEVKELELSEFLERSKIGSHDISRVYFEVSSGNVYEIARPFDDDDRLITVRDAKRSLRHILNRDDLKKRLRVGERVRFSGHRTQPIQKIVCVDDHEYDAHYVSLLPDSNILKNRFT